jgi:uncharacterized protein (TIGR02246 family)
MSRLDATAALQVPARYAQAVDNDDLEALADCLVEDATLEVEVRGTEHRRVHQGRAAILDLFRASFAAHRVRRHLVSSVVVQSLTEKEARIRSYVTVLSADGEALQPTASGVYEDHAVADGGQWRIKVRRGIFDTPAVLRSTFFQ